MLESVNAPLHLTWIALLQEVKNVMIECLCVTDSVMGLVLIVRVNFLPLSNI